MLGLSPATVSRHLSVLLNANLVLSRKDSQWVYYRLSVDFPPLAKQWLMESLFFSHQAEVDRKRLMTVLSCGAQVERDSRGTQRARRVGLMEERRFSRGAESDAFKRQTEHRQNALLMVRALDRKGDAKKEMSR
jgi:DNA-binding transcriptional ArsR family regulator